MKKTPFFQSAFHARFLSIAAAWMTLAVTGGLACQTAQAGTTAHDTTSPAPAQTGTPVVSDWQKRTPFAATTVQTAQTTPASRAVSRKTARRETTRKASPAVVHAAMQTTRTIPVSPDIFRDDTALPQTQQGNPPSFIRINETEKPENTGYTSPMQKGYASEQHAFPSITKKPTTKAVNAPRSFWPARRHTTSTATIWSNTGRPRQLASRHGIQHR